MDGRIETKVQSMDNLQLEENQFDIIWSEGAIYIMGFENGIKAWNRFLKPGGYLGVSELSWFNHSRPKEIEEHWNIEYPQIDTISNNIRKLEKNGYSPIAHFVLPDYCWIENYYKPLEENFDRFLKKHN